MDLEKIKSIKYSILTSLKEKLEELDLDVKESDRLSLLVAFKTKSLTIEIKFNSSDDFDFYKILNAATGKIMLIYEDSLEKEKAPNFKKCVNFSEDDVFEYCKKTKNAVNKIKININK